MIPSTRRSISDRTMSGASEPPAARWPTSTLCPCLRASCSAATQASVIARSVVSLATSPIVRARLLHKTAGDGVRLVAEFGGGREDPLGGLRGYSHLPAVQHLARGLEADLG